MLHVACDLCGHRHQVAEQRLGEHIRCRACDVAVQVQSSNFFDPSQPEKGSLGEPAQGNWRELLANTARSCLPVASGVCQLAVVTWVLSLLWRDPSQASATATSQHGRTSIASVSPPVAASSDHSVPSATVPPLSTAAPTPAVDVTPEHSVPAAVVEADQFVDDLMTPPVTTTADRSGELADETEAKTGWIDSADYLPAKGSAAPPSVAEFGDRRVTTDSHNSTLDHSHSALPVGNSLQPMIDPVTKRRFHYNGPGSIPSSGRRIEGLAAVKVGQIVQVQWGSSWWAADVLSIDPQRRTVRIHYRGWSQSHDEDVRLERLQLAH